MKKINNVFNETAYQYTTAEGLDVILVHKPGFKRTIAVYGTPFGALNIHQKSKGEVIEHKKGLAHFLEHKLFEDDTQDILAQFTELGASGNAFTSYDQTVYYFTTNSEVEEPLKLLLNFVNKFNITQEKVDKEKGIIVEELKMYDSMPDMNLLMRTYENTFHNFPLKYDIGGTKESVESTMLEDLIQAYELNYHPSRMALVVVSHLEPESIKAIVDTVKTDKPAIDVEECVEPEPLTVFKEFDTYHFPVTTPKISLGYKFKYKADNVLKDEFLLRILLTLNFSEFNPNFQNWLDEEIINDFFSFHVELREGFGVVYFFNEGDKQDEFKAIVNEGLMNLELNEDDFNQIVKRFYGQTVFSLSQYDRYAFNLMSTHFKDISYYDYLEDVRDVKFEDVVNIKELLTNFSIAETQMLPKEK